MKKLFLLGTMFFSLNALAANLEWTDLDVNQNYILTKDVTFTNDAKVTAGTKFTLVDRLPGGAGFPYMYFEFQTANCETPDVGPETGEYVLQDHNGRNYKIMTRLDQGCQLGMYVHGSKFYEESLFE